MKAILISIKPRFVVDILNHKKTIEVRKLMPKCNLPIDVYIYCTKDNYLGYLPKYFAGKVVAKFTLNKVEEITIGEDRRGSLFGSCHYGYRTESLRPNELMEQSCLDVKELIDYLGRKTGYAWHISNLEIFDEPKELSEFKSYKKNIVNTKINGMVFETELDNSLIKAPQSMCYIEVE